MGIEKERFVRQMEQIIGSSEQEIEIFEKMYDCFLQFDDSIDFLGVMDYVLSHNIPETELKINDPWISDEEYLLLTDSVVYVAKGKAIDYNNTHRRCTCGWFSKMLKCLNLSDAAIDEFIYKGKMYPKDGVVRYQLNVINNPDDTLSYLDDCIGKITARRNLSYDECKACCFRLIDMIPVNRFQMDKWKNCKAEICQGISMRYAKKIGKKVLEYARDSCAVICGKSYWEQLYEIESYADLYSNKNFAEYYRKYLRVKFDDAMTYGIKKAFDTCVQVLSPPCDDENDVE